MVKAVFWDKESSLNFPGGTFDAEWIKERYPFGEDVKVVLGMTGNVAGSIDSLDVLRGAYDINEGISDEDALAVIEERFNAPPSEPSSAASEEIQALGQQLTDLELLILEGGKV